MPPAKNIELIATVNEAFANTSFTDFGDQLTGDELGAHARHAQGYDTTTFDRLSMVEVDSLHVTPDGLTPIKITRISVGDDMDNPLRSYFLTMDTGDVACLYPDGSVEVDIERPELAGEVLRLVQLIKD